MKMRAKRICEIKINLTQGKYSKYGKKKRMLKRGEGVHKKNGVEKTLLESPKNAPPSSSEPNKK